MGWKGIKKKSKNISGNNVRYEIFMFMDSRNKGWNFFFFFFCVRMILESCQIWSPVALINSTVCVRLYSVPFSLSSRVEGFGQVCCLSSAWSGQSWRMCSAVWAILPHGQGWNWILCVQTSCYPFISHHSHLQTAIQTFQIMFMSIMRLPILCNHTLGSIH